MKTPTHMRKSSLYHHCLYLPRSLILWNSSAPGVGVSSFNSQASGMNFHCRISWHLVSSGRRGPTSKNLLPVPRLNGVIFNIRSPTDHTDRRELILTGGHHRDRRLSILRTGAETFNSMRRYIRLTSLTTSGPSIPSLTHGFLTCP